MKPKFMQGYFTKTMKDALHFSSYIFCSIQAKPVK